MSKYNCGKVIIGCDPEMGVTRARKNFTEAMWGVIEARDSGVTNSSPFGLDGCERIFELRPKQSLDPLQVVANIKTLLHERVQKVPEITSVQWKAGSRVDNEPIGGHIHVCAESATDKTTIREYIPNGFMLFLAPIVGLLEAPSESRFRRGSRSGYGKALDIRRPDHGGIEYRYPSSWITSPIIAAGILTLAKFIAEDIVANRSASPFVKHYEGFDQEALEVINRDKLKSMYATVRSIIEQNANYAFYKAHISPLFAIIDAGKSWFPKIGMLQAWGISPSRARAFKAPLQQKTGTALLAEFGF
jgi:hypothetical protein